LYIISGKTTMTNSKYLDIFCVILLALLVSVEAVHTVQDINKLSAELLTGYNKNTLPSANFDQQFQLGISVGLVALGDIDEVEERLSTVMMFIFTVCLFIHIITLVLGLVNYGY
jgi:hypothetical protein